MVLSEVPDDVIQTVLAPLGINWTPMHRRMLITFVPSLANAEVGKLAEGFNRLMQDPAIGPVARKILQPQPEPLDLIQCPNCGWVHAPALPSAGAPIETEHEPL